MQDALAVGVGDRLEHVHEEPQTTLEVETVVARVREEIETLDVLENEVAAAVVGATAVEEAGDAGMFEASEDLHLVAEPPSRRRRGVPSIEALDRHAAGEALAAKLGEEDSAHAAATDFAHDPVRTDRLRKLLGGQRFGELRGAPFEQRAGALVGAQELAQQRRGFRVAARELEEPGSARLARELARLGEQLDDLLGAHRARAAARGGRSGVPGATLLPRPRRITQGV